MAQLHHVRFPAFGELTSTAQVAAAPSYLAALQARATQCIKAVPLREYFLAALERYAEWFADVTEAGLCHEDLHGWNILFAPQTAGAADEWQLTALLDFDKAWAGYHESDLARLEFWTGMTSAAFWEGYTANREIAPGFLQRKLLYQLFWCLEYARATPRHLADTRRVCAALHLPDITDLAMLYARG